MKYEQLSFFFFFLFIYLGNNACNFKKKYIYYFDIFLNIKHNYYHIDNDILFIF
jgi:hypothetical protein